MPFAALQEWLGLSLCVDTKWTKGSHQKVKFMSLYGSREGSGEGVSLLGQDS